MSQYVQMEDAPPSSSRKLSSASAGGPQVHNALGTFNGCFIPCCLNILGIILFQRLAWAVGQAGISGVLLIFLLAESMAILTVLSFSAIVTNGSMRGGGSYFMISRSLGPEFGGAIGLLFYLAYAVGVAFYISGFSLAVRSSFFEDAPEYSANVYIGTVGLAAVAVISYIGAGVFAKFNIIFFVVQMAAILCGIFSILITSGHTILDMKDTCNDNFPYHHGSSLWDICVENGTRLFILSTLHPPSLRVGVTSRRIGVCISTMRWILSRVMEQRVIFTACLRLYFLPQQVLWKEQISREI